MNLHCESVVGLNVGPIWEWDKRGGGILCVGFFFLDGDSSGTTPAIAFEANLMPLTSSSIAHKFYGLIFKIFLPSIQLSQSIQMGAKPREHRISGGSLFGDGWAPPHGSHGENPCELDVPEYFSHTHSWVTWMGLDRWGPPEIPVSYPPFTLGTPSFPMNPLNLTLLSSFNFFQLLDLI